MLIDFSPWQKILFGAGLIYFIIFKYAVALSLTGKSE